MGNHRTNLKHPGGRMSWGSGCEPESVESAPSVLGLCATNPGSQQGPGTEGTHSADPGRSSLEPPFGSLE